jgi:transcriptional regulator with XRE-family HTH domain
MNEKTIAANIRRLRERQGLTLSKTAELAGLTKSTLSKIETGLISPPISTVLRIGDALGIALAEFFSESHERPNYILTRRGKGDRITRDGSRFGYAYEALALKMSGKKAEPFVLTIKPSDPPGTFQHGGDEFIFVLSGKLEITLGGEEMVLDPGDSLYFNPRLKHVSRALGKKPVRFLDIFVQDEPEKKGKGRRG